MDRQYPVVGGVVIGAPQGRSGKTTVTLGLCAALRRSGLSVQPFKKGPDYIDPSWLSEAAGRACRSLDPFFLQGEAALQEAFWQGMAGAQFGVVEGNHGLYDSAAGDGQEDDGQGSTAAVARALGAPVLLVINAARMGRSAAALVAGYLHFEPETPIRGVILNNVSGSRHESRLRRAIEAHCGVPVLGALGRDEALAIPDRHLGLVPRGEEDGLLPAIAACREAVERGVEVEEVVRIGGDLSPRPPSRGGKGETMGAGEVGMARLTPPRLPSRGGKGETMGAGEVGMASLTPPWPSPLAGRGEAALPGSGTVVGVIRDRAFSFYYAENLEALERAGGRLVFLDALRDERLPAGLGALVIGGGFPEVFMDALQANAGLRGEIRRAVEHGLPVYADCGGLMYLSRGITWQGRRAEMVGALPVEVEMTGKPQGHGYVLAQVDAPNPFFLAGTVLRGHEFHQSRLIGLTEGLATGMQLSRGRGLGGGRDAIVYRNVWASYTHLHAAGAPQWAEGVVRSAQAGG